MTLFNITEIKKITGEQRDNVASTDAVQLSEQQQQILDAVNAGRWGCQDSSVRALVTAITGIDCSKVDSKRSPYKIGAMVVYTRDYSHQETLLIRQIDSDGDAHVYAANGDSGYNDGNNSYLHPLYMNEPSSGGAVRWATDAEIDAFFGLA